MVATVALVATATVVVAEIVEIVGRVDPNAVTAKKADKAAAVVLIAVLADRVPSARVSSPRRMPKARSLPDRKAKAKTDSIARPGRVLRRIRVDVIRAAASAKTGRRPIAVRASLLLRPRVVRRAWVKR